MRETCPVCGGFMVGDGYTTVLHCEGTDPDPVEPDAEPIYCNFEEEPDYVGLKEQNPDV